jgi:O-acetyl-ADP-ribose deacetylase (regulator of RNase III)
MDGGIDATHRTHFGPEIQERVQRVIVERHHGEMLVGAADLVETGHAGIPYMIVAPTMRVSNGVGRLGERVSCCSGDVLAG